MAIQQDGFLESEFIKIIKEFKMGTYAYSGNQNKQRDNHADEYLPDLLNDIQDEIEIVEQVLSGGEEGQVLTADSAGKAKWSAPVGGSGGVFYDEIVLSNILGQTQNCTTVTLLLNGTQITGDAWIIYGTDESFVYGIAEDGVMDIYSGAPGRSPYTLYILGTYGEVVSINLENAPSGDPGSPG